jgi:hypothetical protein
MRLRVMSEFGVRLKSTGIDKALLDKIESLLGEAGHEFPCLSCPSKDECGSFKWFLKWFGTPK